MISCFPLSQGRRIRSGVTIAAHEMEADIQREIVRYIEILAPAVLVFAIPNAASRTRTGRASNAVAGLKKGVFDLGLILPGQVGAVAFIEVKTTRGKLSAEQQHFQDVLIRNRVRHCVARTIDDVREALKIWGVPTREHLPRVEATA